MVKLKICGLKRTQDIEVVNKFKPEYIGFILAPSKRQINLVKASYLKGLLDPQIRVVGVFVNEPLESLVHYIDQGVIDNVQLHGDEDLGYIKALKKKRQIPIIKAIRLNNQELLSDTEKAIIESDFIDYPLLDTYTKDAYGGSGKSFDWKILEQIKRPYFLAGGINKVNIKEAISFGPYAIDISSGVETEGVKDAVKIRELFEIIRDEARK
ncbi:phosphoribosylanthranilate isomerase [Sporanaerobium hydrogeniformans]|uniref:phosphoribosylanthranilate isomerase n=1 Tax=Sporanaerobium hydrogeniformans TaxID=3072179 RepID=UPI0026A2C672|nr:phosphoribosylanthranilate isomerase [Sporanaerobium hydrogeniformans]